MLLAVRLDGMVGYLRGCYTVEFRGGIRIISLNFRICGLCVAVQEIFELPIRLDRFSL
jgi:hypothetical protein